MYTVSMFSCSHYGALAKVECIQFWFDLACLTLDDDYLMNFAQACLCLMLDGKYSHERTDSLPENHLVDEIQDRKVVLTAEVWSKAALCWLPSW